MPKPSNRNTIHVAIVGPLAPPEGGMAGQTLLLAKSLAKQGNSVKIIQSNMTYKLRWLNQIKYFRAVIRLFKFIIVLLKTLPKSNICHLMANSGWSWHLTCTPTIIIAKLFSIPVIVNYRGGLAKSFLNSQHSFILPILRKADLVIVPSSYLENIFAEYNIRTVVVPNMLLAIKSSDTTLPCFESPKIVITRNLEAIYDIATAIKAFSIILKAKPNAELHIAGEGPLLESLKVLSDELNINKSIFFHGRLTHAEITNLYTDATLMLNTSLADNSPNSIIEAMYHGIPVVSTNVGGISHLINHNITGYLVSSHQPDTIAAAVVDLLNSPNKWKAIQISAKQKVKQYDSHQVTQRLINHYNDLMTAT